MYKAVIRYFDSYDYASLYKIEVSPSVETYAIAKQYIDDRVKNCFYDQGHVVSDTEQVVISIRRRDND
jgi:hypothetical protein